MATSRTKWWSNTNSKLSRVLPNLKPLKNQSTHQAIIVVTTISISMLIIEASIGGMDGLTTSINDLILGSSEENYPPPYLDPISGILLTFLTILLWLTSPAQSENEEFD